ncbi:unnamed protein product [Diabrotica balteata]|uniref:Nuclease HARBI1 n=1 Tax=Diabrotica balteata TaxID=107213 RepID=A0A9N9TGM2_DIABA|nr:unnamed protein product [Diabrotica balteata]
MDDNIARIVDIAVDLAEPLLDLAELFPAERPEITRNENYYEVTIPNYSDTQFQEHFRMSRETFEVLLQRVQQFVEVTRIPLRKKLLFTLWTISKQNSFLEAGDRFGFAKSSGHGIFIEMIRVLGQMCQTYINWPNLEAQMHIANVFQRRSHGIPGIVGAIDGCHIQIKQPEGNAFDYYNRKGMHSVILQGKYSRYI